jgi:hypothetical protein
MAKTCKKMWMISIEPIALVPIAHGLEEQQDLLLGRRIV